MAPDIRCLDVAERHHQPGADRADGLGGRHDRLGLRDHFADRRATGLMPDRAMLEFAVTADDRALATGFDGVLAAQPLAQRSGQLPAEIAQVSLKRHQVRLIATGMGIVDDGERGADQ